MIQSVKFDSSNMDIKKIDKHALIFIIKKLVEIFGLLISFIGHIITNLIIVLFPRRPKFYIF